MITRLLNQKNCLKSILLKSVLLVATKEFFWLHATATLNCYPPYITYWNIQSEISLKLQKDLQKVSIYLGLKNISDFSCKKDFWQKKIATYPLCLYKHLERILSNIKYEFKILVKQVFLILVWQDMTREKLKQAINYSINQSVS